MAKRHASVTHLWQLQSTRSNLAPAYNRYFSTGQYQRRYPRVNAHVLKKLIALVSSFSKTCRVLDYGSGTGRYSLALTDACEHVHVTAFDIAQESLNQLTDSVLKTGLSNQIQVCASNQNPLREKPNDHSEAFQVVAMLFGVFSHMRSVDRVQTLLRIKAHLQQHDGALLLSVPNRKRRFLFHQWLTSSPKIDYVRRSQNQRFSLYYQLFDLTSLTNELNAAGFTVKQACAESFFPESWITRSRALSFIDAHICRWLPAEWGYGLLVHCHVKGAPES